MFFSYFQVFCNFPPVMFNFPVINKFYLFRAHKMRPSKLLRKKTDLHQVKINFHYRLHRFFVLLMHNEATLFFNNHFRSNIQSFAQTSSISSMTCLHQLPWQKQVIRFAIHDDIRTEWPGYLSELQRRIEK